MQDWPRAILFDFDGVIVNSEPLHLRAFQQVLADEDIHITEAEYYHDFLGFDDKGAFQHIFATRDRPLAADTLQRVMTRKSQLMRELIQQRQFSALPGVEQFVSHLARHYPLAICSGALRHEIESMLEAIGLRDCFRTIVAAEDVTVGKPDPAGYLMTVQRLAELIRQPLTPADCLIIEDAPSVARSTRAVGFKVLAVANSYPLDQLHDAHWRVPSLQAAVVAAQLPQLRLALDCSSPPQANPQTSP